MRTPRVGPWRPNVRAGGAIARGGAPGVVVEPVLCGVMGWALLGGGRGQAASVHIRSGGPPQGREMCGGDGTAMCGEPRVTAKCTCTEREFGRCSRLTGDIAPQHLARLEQHDAVGHVERSVRLKTTLST